MMKRGLFFLLIFSMQVVAVWCQPASPKYEVRAVWLTTIGGLDWPHSYAQSPAGIEKQKTELRQTLDKLSDAGINMVLLQTRIRGTMLYPSQYEPWDGAISGTPGRSPGYDPLQFAIDECHLRGMECHAWVVTIPIGKWTSYGCKALREKMPNNIIKVGLDGYMNPETQKTATYLADICEEITRRYDIDGIHLDYIRYPEEWQKHDTGQTARNHIDRIVQAISSRVKQLKPWVKMSCSPIGKYRDLPRQSSRGWNAYQRVNQDAQAWVRKGWMDMLLPMMYFRDQNYYPFLFDWKENSNGRIIGTGLGIYFLSPREGNWPLDAITREMQVSRQQGVGQVFFRSKFLTDNVKGIYQFLRDEFYTSPALVPPLDWQKAAKPATPNSFEMASTPAGTTTIQWKGRAPLYNLYFSKQFPVDCSKGENLLATRLSQQHISLPEAFTNRYYFAVTAMNRYGVESEPLQQIGTPNASAMPRFFANDGRTLILPDHLRQEVDATFVIETLQGKQMHVQRINGAKLDIHKLPRGTYQLRSVYKQGKSHRLGFFKK